MNLNNNRNWFQENEERYKKARLDFEQFVESIIPMLKKFGEDIDDISAREYVFRIFRAVRFAKNINPYKTNFGSFISKGGRKSPYAGYYIHIEPDKTFVGGGIYMPESNILKAIRPEIYENIDEFMEIINDKTFKKYFPEIHGEKLVAAPKGFPKEFSDIDLLKHKHYAVVHKINNTFLFNFT